MKNFAFFCVNIYFIDINPTCDINNNFVQFTHMDTFPNAYNNQIFNFNTKTHLYDKLFHE